MNDLSNARALDAANAAVEPPRWTDGDRRAFAGVIGRLPRPLSSIEELRADTDGMIPGAQIEKTLAALLAACGEDPTEWISTRSLAASATFDTRNGVPADWRTVYRWMEVSVVHGGSEGWVVHVRGIERGRADDGRETSRLLVSAKLFNRHDAWRVAEVFANFFDC